MPFEMYGDVILTRDVIERGLHAAVGTVVERHVVPSASYAGYSIEFVDMIGNTVPPGESLTSSPAVFVPAPGGFLTLPPGRSLMILSCRSATT